MDGPVATTVPVGFLSHDGKTQIKGMIWKPEGRNSPGAVQAPVGIVQIVHGMSEHIGRYDDFARFLVSRGFVVCAHDHIGHGKSAAAPEQLGCLPAEGGKDVLVEDAHELRKTVASRYSRQTPYILFGHSLGSFVVRVYLSRYAEGLAGAVLCGTGGQSTTFARTGGFLARTIAKSKGADYRSDFLHSQGAGAFAKQIRNARTPFDWISTDPAVVDAFCADELCGVPFSAGGYATVADLAEEASRFSCVLRVPKDLPVLFVAGAEDPVGDCGRGVRTAADLFLRAGMRNTAVKIYDGMRHEVLNEPGHELVYEDVARWMEDQAGRARAS